MNLTLLLITLLLHLSVKAQTTTCQQENYLEVIGGSNYEVDNIRAAAGSSFIAVGGMLHTTSTLTYYSYFYLFS